MTQHFHPTILGRLFYLCLTCGLSILFLLACLLLRTVGTRFAADDTDILGLIAGILIFAAAILIGFVILHLFRLALSPSPSLIIDAEGIQYRMIGSLKTAKIKWPDVLATQRQGIFKHISLIVVPRQTAEIQTKQHFLYIAAKNIFPLIFLFWLSALKNLQGGSKPTLRRNIRIFRPTIDVPFEKIEKLIQERIKLVYLTTETATTQPKIQTNKSVSAKQHTNKLRGSIGFVFRALALGVVLLLPIASFSSGFKKFERQLQFDPQVQRTQLLFKQAKAGNADAQNKLGWRYDRGVGIRKSKSRAAYWYKLSAKQGFAKAQYNLGLAYQFKRGVKRNYRKAAKWFRRASYQDLNLATEALAGLYYTGKGVTRSYPKAIELFGKAVGKGNGRAEYFLGIMHEKGQGVVKSTDEATNFYKKSAALGYKHAKKALLRMEKQTSRLN